MNNSTKPWDMYTSPENQMVHQDDQNPSMTVLFFVVVLFVILIGCYFVSCLGVSQHICRRLHSDHRDSTVSQTCHATVEELIETRLIIREWKVSSDECPSTDLSSTSDIEYDSAFNEEPILNGSSMSAALKKPCSDTLSEKPGDGCAICLGHFVDQDRVCESNNIACHHIFHSECLIVWLKKQNECPVCRQVFLLKETA